MNIVRRERECGQRKEKPFLDKLTIKHALQFSIISRMRPLSTVKKISVITDEPDDKEMSSF